MTDIYPQWVHKRVQCTREAVFDALYKRVLHDVEEANACHLAGENNQFVVEEDTGSRACAAFTVKRPDGSEVSFQRFDLEIRITRSSNGAFSVRPKWNSRKLSCDLYVEDVSHELWQISQVALEPLFFGPGGDVRRAAP